MDLYFSALDELIQIVYQGTLKFVLISTVDRTSWTVHLGLSGPEGRWWRGKWTDEDVKAITVRVCVAHPHSLGLTALGAGPQTD